MPGRGNERIVPRVPVHQRKQHVVVFLYFTEDGGISTIKGKSERSLAATLLNPTSELWEQESYVSDSC